MSVAASAIGCVPDDTLARAVGAAIDRVEHHLAADDDLMASVAGAIVRRLLAHPCASLYSCDLAWRRMLVRWEALARRLDVAPLALDDLVDHHANVLLIEATRTAERASGLEV